MKINQGQVPWTDEESPEKSWFFAKTTLAVGGRKTLACWRWPPVDVELTKLPPAKANWPLHEQQRSGRRSFCCQGAESCGQRRLSGKSPGDFIVNPPGEAHQIINRGQEDLVTTSSPTIRLRILFYYPDSKKWTMKPPRKVYELTSGLLQR